MIILGIKTSCDEISAAVVQNDRRVFLNVIASQVDVHAPFSGVVLELEARKHMEAITEGYFYLIKKVRVCYDCFTKTTDESRLNTTEKNCL